MAHILVPVKTTYKGYSDLLGNEEGPGIKICEGVGTFYGEFHQGPVRHSGEAAIRGIAKYVYGKQNNYWGAREEGLA